VPQVERLIKLNFYLENIEVSATIGRVDGPGYKFQMRLSEE